MDSIVFKLVDKNLTVFIRQDIDHHVAKNIRVKIDDEIVKAKPKIVILHFGGVEFMDSSGIGLIMGRHKLVKGLDGELFLAGVNRGCRRLMELSGILELVSIVSEVER